MLEMLQNQENIRCLSKIISTYKPINQKQHKYSWLVVINDLETSVHNMTD